MAVDKVDFFIVGAPKCGTTSLVAYLSEHPSICFSRRKEPLYFATDLDHAKRARNFADYMALFERAREDQITGEASVWYLYSRTAVKNILAHNPNAKIIIMLRNPADAAYSLHGQFLRSGNENVIEFEKAWLLQDERKQGRHIPRRAHFPQGLQYADVFMLFNQIERVNALVDQKNIFVIVFDEFKNDPMTAHLQLLRFLGLAELPLQKYEARNEAVSVLYPRLTQFVDHPPINIWKLPKLVPFRNLRERLQAHVTAAHKAAVRATYGRARRPSIDHEMKRYLQSYFASDVHALGKLLGRDLSMWTDV